MTREMQGRDVTGKTVYVNLTNMADAKFYHAVRNVYENYVTYLDFFHRCHGAIIHPFIPASASSWAVRNTRTHACTP